MSVSVPAKAALKKVGVTVGPKTTRHRVLQLLDERVLRKKQRLTEPLKAIRPRLSLPTKRRSAIIEDEGSDEEVAEEPEVDFGKFGDSQLAQMLHDVGLQTAAMDRNRLVETCRMYRGLSKCCPIHAEVSDNADADSYNTVPAVILPSPSEPPLQPRKTELARQTTSLGGTSANQASAPFSAGSCTPRKYPVCSFPSSTARNQFC